MEQSNIVDIQLEKFIAPIRDALHAEGFSVETTTWIVDTITPELTKDIAEKFFENKIAKIKRTLKEHLVTLHGFRVEKAESIAEHVMQHVTQELNAEQKQETSSEAEIIPFRRPEGR